MATVRATVIYATNGGRPIKLEVPIYPYFDCWANTVEA